MQVSRSEHFFNLTLPVFIYMVIGAEDSAKNGLWASARAERSKLCTAQGSASVLGAGTGTMFCAERGDRFFFGVTQSRTSAIRAAPPFPAWAVSSARRGSRLVAPWRVWGWVGCRNPTQYWRWARLALWMLPVLKFCHVHHPAEKVSVLSAQCLKMPFSKSFQIAILK